MSEVLDRAFDAAEKSHWQIKSLGEVCRTSSGGTPSRSRPDFFNGNIPWVKSGELTDGLVSEVSEFISEEALAGSSAKLLPAGTLLIAMYGATVGKLGVLARAAATNQAVCAIFPPPELDPKFLFWFLRRQRSDLIAKAVGGAQPNISQTILRDLELPIPPIGEQREIVAELEKQFSRLDEAVANLQRVKANLKRYKASVLKAAVEGRLVEIEATLARREGRTYETGEQLLQRILEERRANWAGRGKYKEPDAASQSELDGLPDGWTWIAVDSIAFVTKLAGFEYTKYVTYADDGDLAVLKAENAGPDGFRRTDFSRVHSDSVSTLTRSRVVAGDLLMVFVGAGTGNVACTPNDREYFLGPNIAMIRVDPANVNSPYLEMFLRSPTGKNLALGFTKAVAQPSLSMGNIRMIPVALPPIAEQVRIVAEVDRHLSIIREVESEVDANRQRAQALRQATLSKAFSGDRR